MKNSLNSVSMCLNVVDTRRCDIAAAPTTDAQNTSWVHVYLVWDWLAVRVTISHKGQPLTCDWASDSLFSIRPVVM